MAEEGQAVAAEAAEEPQFVIERIYIKDVSFESPNSPAIFTQEWDPDTNLQLNTQVTPLSEGHYEVELMITITVKSTYWRVIAQATFSLMLAKRLRLMGDRSSHSTSTKWY